MTGASFLKPGPKWWRPVARVAAWFALLACMVLYVSYQQNESDQRWCRLLSALTTDVPPPTTARAKEIAGIMADMKHDFHC